MFVWEDFCGVWRASSLFNKLTDSLKYFHTVQTDAWHQDFTGRKENLLIGGLTLTETLDICIYRFYIRVIKFLFRYKYRKMILYKKK